MAQLELDKLGKRPTGQVFKWLGSKFKNAYTIISYFPENYNTYIEPFLGTGAILATLGPKRAIAGDILAPLIEIWKIVQEDPKRLVEYYNHYVPLFKASPKSVYKEILDRYNAHPNGPDLLLLTRMCYGGVIRFTREGKMSTPAGVHAPMSPKTFERVVYEWQQRLQGTTFLHQSYQETMALASQGDLVYCDPPYIDSQRILYGAQAFRFEELLEVIEQAKKRGAKIALSIDGRKKSGKKVIQLDIPEGLFAREIFIDRGSSMLRRFQKSGEKMEGEEVSDRLLLTW